MAYPTYAEVDKRIVAMQADPKKRAPSGDYCRACMLSGISHCSDPSRVGETSGCRERVAFK